MKHLIHINWCKVLVFGLIFFQFVSCEKYEETEIIDEHKDTGRLPQISINTNGVEIIDEPKINATINIIESGTLLLKVKLVLSVEEQVHNHFLKNRTGLKHGMKVIMI